MAVQKDILENAGVPAQDVQRLEAAWAAYQSAKAQPARDIPRIVCTGIYNAGKSTLLNALTGTEQFPIGDVPTTKAVAQAELDGAVYIDTPGLNAAEADDMETQAAYETADFILFVSSAVSGGISQAEAQWLRTLGERWDLEQRLIFVLTKCSQAGPEELSGIAEQFRRDLEKIVGFGEVIPVDSITYRKGSSEGKALLVEHSGIPALKEHLAEKIAAADRLLAQAREEERNQRRQEVLGQIEQVQTALQDKKDQAGRKNLEQIAAVDRLWAEFEKALWDAMPSGTAQRHESPRTAGYALHMLQAFQKDPLSFLDGTFEEEPGLVKVGSVRLDYRSGSDIKERSESAALRKLAEQLRPYYDRRERAAKDAAFRYLTMQEIRSEWCSTGPDSIYAKNCNKINQLLDSIILNVQKLGATVSPISEIFVTPELPADLACELEKDLTNDLVDYGEYYTLSKYVEMYADVSSMDEYVSGVFGIQRQVTTYYVYSYNGYNVIREMEKDLQKNVDFNGRRANLTVNRYWQEFRKKLEPEVASRKSTLKRQVDAYRSTLIRSAVPANLQNALNHLDALRREVSQ